MASLQRQQPPTIVGAAGFTGLTSRKSEPRMVVSGAKKGAGLTTSFQIPAASYTPDLKDLDGLIALLADERPSRFIDFSGARSLGDNALRAATELLKKDPRALAAHPTDAPWTAAERKKAAAAIQKWWHTHRHEHVK